jgi:hypothetical protein
LLLFIGVVAKSQQRNEKLIPTSRLIRFYPNPATTFIQFEIPVHVVKESQLQIFNFLGKKVVDLPYSPVKARVDLTSFTRGIYIFQLKDKTGKILESGKFQIEK